jgi:RNA polymerase sigma-70 factor (ECF subfamily)
MPGVLRFRTPQRPPEPPAAFAADDEEALVAAARLDRRAFAPLYARYAEPIYRYCYARLGSHEAAEDATSLVFAKALAALPRYRHRSFRSWLFAIAHNVVVDDRRAARGEQPLERAHAQLDPARTPEEDAVAADEERTLRAALGQLTVDQRRVVELRLSGLNDHEIADVLGRPYATVRTIQYRAVGRLRSLLGVTPRNEGA